MIFGGTNCAAFFNIMSDDFINVFEILNDSFLDSKKAQIAVKYSTIFSFWPQIVGSKFADSSKPIAIKNFKLHVVCENSFVVQELLMYKKIILNKLLPYCKPLGVEISDILFEYKNWANAKLDKASDDFPNFYTDDELSKVSVDISDFEAVFNNIDNSEYLSNEQKEKFKNRILKLQKAKKLRFS